MIQFVKLNDYVWANPARVTHVVKFEGQIHVHIGDPTLGDGGLLFETAEGDLDKAMRILSGTDGLYEMRQADIAAVAFCKEHQPVQHRDRMPPWCNECGRSQHGSKFGPSKAESGLR